MQLSLLALYPTDLCYHQSTNNAGFMVKIPQIITIKAPVDHYSRC